MKKWFNLLFICMFLFVSVVPAWGQIYTPPTTTEIPVTQEDIDAANAFFDNLKWDYSETDKGILYLTMPKAQEGYALYINKKSIDDMGVGISGSQFYTYGFGGETLRITVRTDVRTRFEFGFFNENSGRMVAVDYYNYTPGEKVVYWPVEDRIFASKDIDGNIIAWYDMEGNEVNMDGSPINDSLKGSKFKDIFSDFWAYDDIVRLTDLGYLQGYPDGYFKPYGNITRAEFSAMFVNLLKDKYSDASHYDNQGVFKGLPDYHWGHDAVYELMSFMKQEEALNIFGQNFKPDQKITREEVVATIHAVLKNHGNFDRQYNADFDLYDIEFSSFPDSIKFSIDNDIIVGYPDNTFKPFDTIKRAEIVAVIARMIEKF